MTQQKLYTEEQVKVDEDLYRQAIEQIKTRLP